MEKGKIGQSQEATKAQLKYDEIPKQGIEGPVQAGKRKS